MAVTLHYLTEFGKPALQKTICGGIYARVVHFLVRVQCRRKESSRSLSHLLMSFLFYKSIPRETIQHSLNSIMAVIMRYFTEIWNLFIY